jgi:hypothetical protein
MATTDPTATANNGSFDIAAAIAAAQGSGGAGATKDPAIVPLWKVRPSVAPPPNRRNGGQQEPSDAQSSDLARMAAAPVTATEASSTWLDMSDDDRKAFYKLALSLSGPGTRRSRPPPSTTPNRRTPPAISPPGRLLPS